MKNLKLGFVALCGLVLTFNACKKDDDASSQSKLIGKWQYVSQFKNNYYDNKDHKDTTNGAVSDYVDFRNDGKVYSYMQKNYDTLTYKLIDDGHLKIESDTAQIKTLTTSTLVIYQKRNNSVGYTEITQTFKK